MSIQYKSLAHDGEGAAGEADGGGAVGVAHASDAPAGGTVDLGGPTPHADPGAGLVVPPAAKQPALADLLHQVLASTQAVAASTQSMAARVAALEQGQGQHDPPGQQHMPMGGQPAGAALAVAQLLPWAPRGLGAQPPQGFPEPSQLAAATVAVKANARLVADV